MQQHERLDFSLLINSSLVPPPSLADRIQRQPECRLLWAVLESALETYRKYNGAKSLRRRRLFQEAEEWIFQDDPAWFCSFINICHALSIDPDYLRSGLRRWRMEACSLEGFKQAA